MRAQQQKAMVNPITSAIISVSHKVHCATRFLRRRDRNLFRSMVMAGFSFPSAAPSDARRWPLSCTARVSQAKRPSELIRCIRRQTRGRALTVRNRQRRSRYLLSAFSSTSVLWELPVKLLRTDLPWLDGSCQSIAHSGQQERNPRRRAHREYFPLKNLQSTQQPPSRLRPHRRSCCFVRLVDVRHATSSTFKDIKVGQAPKSRRCSSEPHNLSAAWADRRPWRVFTRVFVAHGRKRSLNRNVVRSRPAAALAHQCGNGELTNKQKNWYRIRLFGDDHHRDDLPRGETCIGKGIRKAYWFYAKVELRSERNVTRS